MNMEIHTSLNCNHLYEFLLGMDYRSIKNILYNLENYTHFINTFCGIIVPDVPKIRDDHGLI